MTDEEITSLLFCSDEPCPADVALDRCGLLDQLAVVILVSSEWHMRRVLLTAQAGFPQSVRFVCCPTCEGCDRQNWTESEACRHEVLNEALLLEAFLETGVIRLATSADELR